MNRLLTTSFCVALVLAGWLTAPGQVAADYHSYIVRRTNLYRSQHGLPPLRVSPLLDRAARYHAQAMAARRVMAHSLDGTGPGERLSMVGYRWSSYGENIAWSRGYSDPAAAAMNGWIQSPGHRANLLGRQFSEIGVGWATSSNGAVYFCQVFGSR